MVWQPDQAWYTSFTELNFCSLKQICKNEAPPTLTLYGSLVEPPDWPNSGYEYLIGYMNEMALL